MSEFGTPTVEPSYLLPLALHTLPFSPTKDTFSFFKGDQISQSFNLLRHLIHASDKVAVVLGDDGLGKTVFLAELEESLGDEFRVFHIDEKQSSQPLGLMGHCLSQLGMNEDEILSSSNHGHLLRQRCQRLQSLNIKPLLLVDDIEQLANETVAAITDWLLWEENNEFLLQAVLTAKQVRIELKPIHDRMQRIDLFPLSKDEVSHYIMHKLVAAGYQGNIPFEESVVDGIAAESAGNPALVNQLSHQQLLRAKPTLGAKILDIKPGVRSKLRKAMGVLSTKSSDNGPISTSTVIGSDLNPLGKSTFNLKWLLLALPLVLLLIFQDKINSLFSASTTIGDISVVEVLPEIIEDDHVATVIIEPEIEAAVSTDSTEPERAELTSLVAALSELDPVDSDPVSKPVATSTANNTKLDPDTYQQREWILKQKSDFFTYQLMGSWKVEDVNAFIKKYSLMGDVAVFKRNRDEEIWYVLVYGVYESKDAASQASKGWPEPLKSVSKWLRPFSHVQKQVKSLP